MKELNTKLFASVLILLCGVFGATSVFAKGHEAPGGKILDNCQYLPLATNLVFPKKFGKKNTTECVDIPVNFEKAKIIFNMDTDSVDGKGNANGLKHMVMMGAVMKEKIAHHMIKPENVSIIGIMHGSAIKWATKKSDQKKWIDQIFKLKREGVNIQLEACAVTMNGAGLTKKNLYSYTADGKPDPKVGGRIYLNQGAFGRELYLQNHGYAYAEEGYDYHAKK